VPGVLLAGCDGVQSALRSAGAQSQAIDQVWTVMVWTCSVLYLVVLVALAWALWGRQARREGITRDASIAHALTAWVVIVVGILTWFVTVSYLEDRRLQGSNADLQIRITAKQWWWQVEYLDDEPSRQFITANELQLPLGKTARIELRAADVIHSFWVPALSGKQDLVPGRTNTIWLTPRQLGRYRGQCAEFCGLQHAHMALDVTVRDPASFANWWSSQLAPAPGPTGSSAQSGAHAFARAACATCHTIRGTLAGGRIGPDLTHLASRASLAAGALPLRRGELQAWIADPQHFKPGNRMPAVLLSADDLRSIVDYLMELK
jgi:cytochrome c oxidase subunit II